ISSTADAISSLLLLWEKERQCREQEQQRRAKEQQQRREQEQQRREQEQQQRREQEQQQRREQEQQRRREQEQRDPMAGLISLQRAMFQLFEGGLPAASSSKEVS
ncbi:hypothetical protein TSOC_003505, partial [Tetrabaena socialis]